MSKIKVAVIYYSSTGTNYQLAKWAKEAAEDADAEVKVLKIPELAPKEAIEGNPLWKAHREETKDIPNVTLDDLTWADAYIFSMPSRFGNVPGQFKQFLDTTGGLWAKGHLNNKVVSAMSSANNDHGGQEATILSIYTSMAHWGAIIVPPGYTSDVLYGAGGNPYGTSVTVDENAKMKTDVEAAVKYQASRTVDVAQAIQHLRIKKEQQA